VLKKKQKQLIGFYSGFLSSCIKQSKSGGVELGLHVEYMYWEHY